MKKAREPITHELKTVQPYFDAVLNETKTFEVRKNDRDFRVGDLLKLKEYDLQSDSFSHRWVLAEVTYILSESAFVKRGFVILGINPLVKGF